MEEKMKIAYCIDQLDRLYRLYKDAIKITNKVSDYLIRYDYQNYKNNLDFVANIFAIYFNYVNYTYSCKEINKIINDNLKDLAIDIENKLLNEINNLESSISNGDLYFVSDKVKNMIKDEINNTKLIINKNENKNLYIINYFINTPLFIDYPQEKFSYPQEKFSEVLMKIKNDLINYANSLELPTKTDWDIQYEEEMLKWN